MHELAVTESLLEIVIQFAEENQAQVVTDVALSIGALSSIIDDSVQFYWDHISQGTICEGALLHFTRPVARMSCQQCGYEFEMGDELVPCPRCASFDLRVVSGDEMTVDEIEFLEEGTDA